MLLDNSRPDDDLHIVSLITLSQISRALDNASEDNGIIWQLYSEF